MATSKTLTPTNVTISIPAMTDVPDASVFSNCVDKEADAINAMYATSQLTITPSTNISIASVSRAYLIGNRFIYLIVKGSASDNVNNAPIFTISGTKNFITAGTIPIGLGYEWTINAIGYGFINGKTFTASVDSGKWFHINALIPCA